MKDILSWLIATTRRAGWAPILVVTIHLIAAKVLGLYQPYPWIDIPMHLAGGFVIAYWFSTASIEGSKRKILGTFQRRTHVLLVFGWTGTATVLWEFIEFLVDKYLDGHMQAGDLNDTLKDMLLGMVGGVAYLLVSRKPTVSDES